MATKQYLDADGLAVVASKVNEKLKVVATMPATPTSGQVVLYVGATTTDYTQGGIYLYNGTAWQLISTADVESKGIAFKGTRSAYNTAKLIPEGSDGHIPSGALVIITDEGSTYVTNGTGSGQTLELVANATFNGSHAEWNALTLAQKAMYNIVNFTDDEAIGLTVSDVVQDGNMNPVSSNAVYDALQSVDITDQFNPNSTYIDGFHVAKFGKVIDIVFTTQRIDGSNVTGCTGLPIPRNNSTEYGMEVFGDGTLTFTRVESDGTLVANPSSLKIAVGHITYISE